MQKSSGPHCQRQCVQVSELHLGTSAGMEQQRAGKTLKIWTKFNFYYSISRLSNMLTNAESL